MNQLSLPLWSTPAPARPRTGVLQDAAGLILAARLGALLREPVEVELTDNADRKSVV